MARQTREAIRGVVEVWRSRARQLGHSFCCSALPVAGRLFLVSAFVGGGYYVAALSPLRVDATDPFDGRLAAAVALGTPTPQSRATQMKTLSPMDRQDWLRVELDAGTVYTIRIQTLRGSSPARMTLCNALGSPVDSRAACSVGTQPQILTCLPPQRGAYYLRIENASAGGACSYRIAYAQGTESDEWDKRDSTVAGATTLTIPVPSSGVGTGAAPTHRLGIGDTADWYSVSLSDDAEYMFWLAGATTTPAVEVYQAAGPVLQRQGSYGKSGVLYFTPPADGTYLLKVLPGSSLCSGFYQLAYGAQSIRPIIDWLSPAEGALVEGANESTAVDIDVTYSFIVFNPDGGKVTSVELRRGPSLSKMKLVGVWGEDDGSYTHKEYLACNAYYRWEVSVTDEHGHSAEETGTFKTGGCAIGPPPGDGDEPPRVSYWVYILLVLIAALMQVYGTGG